MKKLVYSALIILWFGNYCKGIDSIDFNNINFNYPLLPKFQGSFLGVNNGPTPYRADLGSNNLLVGGIDPIGRSEKQSATSMSKTFHSLKISSVRNNDIGGAFDLSCMFPISDLNSIPKPEEIGES
eukprot:Pgem_evm1s2486